MIYEELSGNLENFEIVLIYVHGWFEDYYGRTDEASFLHVGPCLGWQFYLMTQTLLRGCRGCSNILKN